MVAKGKITIFSYQFKTIRVMKKVFVLSVGIVNMTTGKTMYDWSIYENPGTYAFLTTGGYLLFGVENSLQIGDNVDLIGNDSNRRLSKKHQIVAISKATQEDLLKMLKENDYDYYPIKAFRKRASSNRKLSTSYSIKGIQ